MRTPAKSNEIIINIIEGVINKPEKPALCVSQFAGPT
jgi:hypothetical protein